MSCYDLPVVCRSSLPLTRQSNWWASGMGTCVSGGLLSWTSWLVESSRLTPVSLVCAALCSQHTVDCTVDVCGSVLQQERMLLQTLVEMLGTVCNTARRMLLLHSLSRPASGCLLPVANALYGRMGEPAHTMPHISCAVPRLQQRHGARPGPVCLRAPPARPRHLAQPRLRVSRQRSTAARHPHPQAARLGPLRYMLLGGAWDRECHCL